MKKIISFFLCICASLNSYAQNETTKWYFGAHAALDFMTNPPAVLNNSAMDAPSVCSSIADAAGNLLFYTDGVSGTIWNKQHQVMANGTGLYTGGAPPLIIKHGGNPNLHYVLTSYPNAFATPPGSITGLYCAEVDMSLATGNGSVTAKNISIYKAPSQQLHATRHANGVDYWIMVHEYSYSTNNFRAYLLTSAGINTTAVVSSVGTIYGSLQSGTLKFSPTGQKLCIAINAVSVMLYDFDNTTGVVSNPLTLHSNPLSGYFGCEFSPDGTKLYAGTDLYTPNTTSCLTQWDLGAGTGPAIVSSSVTLVSGTLVPGALQLAPNGKIYIASHGSSSLSVINNPNAAGTACNLVVGGQPVAAAINATLNSYSRSGLPNMVASTKSAPCANQTVSNPQTICSGSSYAISNRTYTSTGSYIDTLANVFDCNGITIVNTQLTVNNSPNLSVNTPSAICVDEPITFTASGAATYTWNTSTTGSQYTTSTYTTTGNVTYSIQLQGTGNAGCVSSKTVSANVLVQACDVGIVDKDLQWYSHNIRLFPNPTEADLTITFGIQADVRKISIVNSLGQMIREEHVELKNNAFTLQTSGLDKGIYLLQFNTSAGIVTKQFVRN